MTVRIDASVPINTPDVTLDGASVVPTTSFVTIDEYAAATGQTIVPNSPNETKIMHALEAACTAIRQYLGQTLDKVLGDVVYLDGTGFRRVLLPELPVLGVTEVIIDEGLTTETIVVAGPTDDNYKLRADSGVLFRKNAWRLDFMNVKVTYDHGYDPIPADLRNVAIQVARTAIAVSPGGIVSETIGGYSYSLGQVTQQGVELFSKVLNTYKLRKIPVG